MPSDTPPSMNQQKHPDSPLWHPAVPYQGFSLRCFLGVHHWRAWSQVYMGTLTVYGKESVGVKVQERYCGHCNKREARNAV